MAETNLLDAGLNSTTGLSTGTMIDPMRINPFDPGILDKTFQFGILRVGQGTFALSTFGLGKILGKDLRDNFINRTIKSGDELFFKSFETNFPERSKNGIKKIIDWAKEKLPEDNKFVNKASGLLEKAEGSWLGRKFASFSEKRFGTVKKFWNLSEGRTLKGLRLYSGLSLAWNIIPGTNGSFKEGVEDYYENIIADRTLTAGGNLAKKGYNWVANNTWRDVTPKITNLEEVVSTVSKPAEVVDDAANVASKGTQTTANATTQTATKAAKATETSVEVLEESASKGTKLFDTQKGSKVIEEVTSRTGDAAKVVDKVDDFTKAADDIASVATKSTRLVNFASKAAPVLKFVGTAGAVAAPLITGWESYNNYKNAGTEEEKNRAVVTGSVATVITAGAATASIVAVASTNFWNPVGWVAGAYLLVDAGVGLATGKGLSQRIGEGVSDMVYGEEVKPSSNLLASSSVSINSRGKTDIKVPEIKLSSSQIAQMRAEAKFTVRDDVEEMQKMLNDKFHMKIAVDGKWGAETTRALVKAGLMEDVGAAIGLDQKRIDNIKKFAESDNQMYFKMLNQRAAFGKMAEVGTEKAIDLIEHPEHKKEYQNKVKLDADLKRSIAEIKDTTFASESTYTKVPPLASLILADNKSKQPTKS